ncbi:BCCT family transporter [Millisia brevis]|uniref:BCCT family transporter n=1 Tax=Millisia brevis TaxID=264148 RepID=UPI0009FE2C60|nr:BCCT family transporter [Millisia brevis]
MTDDATTVPGGDGHHHPALDSEIDRPDGGSGIDTIVFGVTAVVSLAFVVWGIFSTESLASSASSGLSFVVHNFGWLFSLAASGFVIFVLWLALGKFGRIPLGRDGEAPEFRTTSWIAMMFSAGMGIGLMFYGVAEPLWHFIGPPPGTPGGDEALETAMATTLFHWTLHPWAIYAVVGLAIAYGVFRRGRSLQISAVFTPLLGEKAVRGWPGRVIDIFAIFATLFGSATSLGLGALQIGSGLQVVGWVGAVGNTLLIVIIVILTIAFILSAVSGVAKGIQWLANINMVLAVVLAFFVFVAGPTVFILNLIPTTVGSYLQDLAMMAARTDASGGENMQAWLSSWTIFYWAWWISWTPFVGMFIARISRGRTIRQFVTGVLLTPSLVSLVWFAVFGGAALRFQSTGTDLTEDGQIASENMLFEMLSHLPLEGLTSVLVIILVAIFFVSGADAASMVMGTLSERGTLEPSRWNVIFWGAATGAVAAVMLQIGGADALSGLQNITIVAALPFLVIMIGMAASLLRDLRHDPIIVRGRYATAAVEQAVVTGVSGHGDDFAIAVEGTEPGHGVGSSMDGRYEATSTGSQPIIDPSTP